MLNVAYCVCCLAVPLYVRTQKRNEALCDSSSLVAATEHIINTRFWRAYMAELHRGD